TGFCASATALQTASLTASLHPNRLGSPTTIEVAFKIRSIPPEDQMPLIDVGLQLPEEMGIATSGLGLANCQVPKLEELGPKGCPVNALMGRGIATAEIPFAGEVISESARIELFSAPVKANRLSLLVYVDARSPVFAQLVFPATVLPASSPFGETIDTSVPLVPTLPGAPDVAVTLFHMTIGATSRGDGHFLYERVSHGKRMMYSPKGLLLPPRCPKGGFPFQAHFVFSDQTTATARTSVPCPPHKDRTA
ncbi:MAG TPA: hypothetical protein VMB05_06775, partial [Solirubrobacteraceae bacterium]|nr:hypothetical protein [Solirubrobacteraceae bacterium]